MAGRERRGSVRERDDLKRAGHGPEAQPVSRIEWIHRSKLRANSYNPNLVAPPELFLIKVSILQDGWTQPLVARPDFEIVDGYHRWLVAADPEVYALTDGFVPVSFLRPATPGAQMMSTIRHNRARGVHTVLKMADVIQALLTEGHSRQEIATLLQMEYEEIDRLVERGNMPKRGRAKDFNKGWEPDDGRR